MRGIAYGVGVGPGDPQLMTFRAAKLIRENEVIAVPGREPKEAVAYRIAAVAVPEIAGKVLVPIHMPMTKDRELMAREHRKAARRIESYLDKGKNVVYITLGDPTIYCTFSYIQPYLESDGYPVELVPGVSSFCAAAARLNQPLVVGEEQLHVLPASFKPDQAMEQPGTCVFMKSGDGMKSVREMLRKSGRQAQMVENCGMEDEKLYRCLDDIPDDAGYFSVIIAAIRVQGEPLEPSTGRKALLFDNQTPDGRLEDMN